MELRVQCERCGSEYQIPKERFGGKPSKFTCKKCNSQIFLLPSATGLLVNGGKLVEEIGDCVEPGLQLGAFQDLERLSSGGMGTIYKATMHGAEGFAKTVALKVLHPHLSRDAAFANALVDEAKITVLLNHPNIVQMVNLERSGEHLYCVMEYVPGQSLAQIQRAYRRKRAFIPLPMALFIVSEALEGLAYAHDLKDAAGEPLGIVHCDISPHNIMVTADGWVKIIDFGIAKAAARMTHTRPGTIKGKFAYMAPEQFKGESDHRVDVFAMGVVLWELLAGIRLFYANTDVDTLQKVLHLEPPALSMDRPDIPKGLDRILTRAMAKVPDQRYPGARAFKADLIEFASSNGLGDLRASVDIHAAEFLEPESGADGFTDVTPALDANEMFDAATRAEQCLPSGVLPTAASAGAVSGRGRSWLWWVLGGAGFLGLAAAAWLAWPLLVADTGLRSSGAGSLPPPLIGPAAGMALDGSMAVEHGHGPDAGLDVQAEADAGIDAALDGGDPATPADPRPVALANHPRPAKPVVLTRVMVQKRLERQGARLQQCADRYLIQAGLGKSVELILEFTIDSSGRVIRSGLKPASLESTAFGRCLVSKVRSIRFPRQVDRSVTVGFPLRFVAEGTE